MYSFLPLQGWLWHIVVEIVYGFHYYFFYKRIIKIEIFEAPLRHEKYLHHFAGIIYGSNSMSYMKTKENQPQFRKLLLYPDELRRHTDIMYKTRQNILQAKFFLPALFSARQPRLPPARQARRQQDAG